MEISYFIKLFLKRKWLFLAMILLFEGVSLSFYFLQENKYEASLLFYVKRKVEDSNGKYYTYDGYYASQVGKEYSDTVIGFLESIEVLKRAGEITTYIPQEVGALQSLSHKITVSKEAPQILKVSVTTEQGDKSKEIVKAVGQAGIERIRLLNQTGDPNLSVDVIDSEPLVFMKKISLTSLLPLGVGFGFLLALGVTLCGDLYKKSVQSKD